MPEIILAVRDLRRVFQPRAGLFAAPKPPKVAVDGISLTLERGESLGIVGESGSGKSTLARLITRLDDPTSGSVDLLGEDFLALSGDRLRRQRRRIQMVFQDPYASLNPRRTIGDAIDGAIRAGETVPDAATRRARIAELLRDVGLDPPERYATRLPKDLSGGQRQRVGIARALACEPDIVVADEAVSALDVSVRAQILNLFNGLRARRGLSYLFISHDLDVIRNVCDRVIVMQAGRVVEAGDVHNVLARPEHPYTRQLVASALRPDPGFYRARAPRTALDQHQALESSP